ncbi:hypothetical protein CIL05_04825 [Virgibacillus profundi]|uniref:Uncharacterized protein n=1 Tax=Virgibacillus profundi TaxID=2024555 RepID=A0A2A2IIW1_9BACI|nr:hypothetical protein [Virgibacillus profundi]PAV31035.1 hypothetical protein CIL05_04825 [Virgibacillus profundi]PXY55221.1 hypothetical protein CIT14_04910 [Virgibacillus profundi]
MKQAVSGIVLYGILLIPPVRIYMESIMVLHMLVQLPLLILAGWLVGRIVINKFQRFFAKWNGNGIPGILLVMIITMYWMLPRAMDEALTYTSVEIFKFIGLSLFVGVPLRDSWNKLKGVGKSFIFLNYLPMFGLMAWLYIDSPIQICNNYLELEQKILGWGFLIITAVMVLYIIQMVFTDHSEEEFN